MNTQQRWRQVDQIFSASLELDPAQRPAFLNESCGEDTALRRDVEELLAIDESSRPALDAVTWGAPAVSAAGPSAGTQLGLYELIEPLGEGGMGRVYRARRVDGQYEREVAIKVLKNSLLRRETLGRFRNECRLLAQLEHDGIARLYDAGSTPEGLPYLVMELVTGTRLDDFARQPERPLRQRLELFRAICRAVSHAHQHLIVHRDLKPGNILVTEDLRPKLLDFGIAKALAGANVEPCDWTVDRSPMTPHYASPEQHSGAPVTTATDVYALGVLLGELLTGEAASGSPPEATALATVPTDLEAVLHKATAERPEDRYPSAEQLGEEIGRFLDGAPVLAHPPTLAYRVRRFAGRHRWPLTAAALVFLLVSSAALGLAVLAGELAQQRDRARLEARTSQQVTDFLVDLFAQSEPGNRGEREPSASEMLQRGSERIAQSFDHSPADLPVQAALLGAIGRAYQALSRFDDAAPMLDRAVKLQRAADNPAGSSEALLQLAEVEHQRSDNERAELLAHEALSGLAELQAGAAPLQARAHRILGAAATQRGDLDAAERWLSAALAAHQELFGGSSEAVGRDQSALAALAFERRDSAAAETHASAAVEAFQSALGPDHPQVLSALTSLTVALQNQAKLDRVIATYQDLLRRQRRVFGDQHETVAITLNDLGTTYYDLEDFQAAEGELRSSLEILYALGSEGTLSDAEISKNLARTLWEAGRQGEAIEQYRRVLEIFRQRVENTSPSLGAPLTFLGGALCSVGDVQEGEALLEEAREIYLASLGPEHYRLALLDGTRAKCRLQGNDPREARRLLESARARASEHFGADHRIVRKMLALMAEIPPDIEHDASGH